VKIDLFDYDLPKELIAQTPAEPRDHSRLMVVNKKTRSIEHRHFYDIIDYLLPDDLIVINDTRVIPARLLGKKSTGAQIEIFLLNQLKKDDFALWNTLVKPGKRVKEGTVIEFGKNAHGESLCCECVGIRDDGSRDIEFHTDSKREILHVMKTFGNVPLPPYITEKLEEPERYQTVYSKNEGAVAAPTAGLHFTPDLMKKVEESGVEFARVTLHVGLGTFRPVECENLEEHKMHSEKFFVEKEQAQKILQAKKDGRRIVALGTTSVRVLECLPDLSPDEYGNYEGDTDIFIYPPYDFKMVDALITNFHLPKSTLLVLISAFSGRDLVLEAYKTAVENKYRFFSFGDACFLI